jgi:lipid A 3-O-deacylase
MHRLRLFMLLTVEGIACVVGDAYAQDVTMPEDDKGVVNIVLENDSFANEDRDYTNGIRVAMLSSEEHMPVVVQNIARMLPLASDGHKRIGVALGQSMFAPDDISRRIPLVTEHPYAGWLYGSVGMVSDTGTTLDNVMLTLGVVGPMSMAEQTQKFVHHVVDSEQPQGWDSQLRNEMGVVLTYERKWRGLYEASPFGVGVDVTPLVGVNLGNVNTDASVGATFRLGYDLPADYGPPRIRPSLPGSDFFLPSKELGGYIFTTVGEQAVVRNIFLDGNTFHDSAHVNKETWVGSVQVGAAMTYGMTRLSYTQVFMSKEYATQDHAAEFGVVTLSHRF